jgi:hypothetical protein
MENTEMEKGCNYWQEVGSCDRLVALQAAVKLKMFEPICISQSDFHSPKGNCLLHI